MNDLKDTHPSSMCGARLKVLISAYACEPSQGSEPGTGFAWVREAAKRHDVWVLTRANNRQRLREGGLPDTVTPLYVDPPKAMTWWKRGQRGIYPFYALWQRTALARAREEHARIGFDIVHHATFANYWLPTWIWQIEAPFVWGPVGGGESIPPGFLNDLERGSAARERLRSRALKTAESLGWPQAASRHAAACLATSDGMAQRLTRLGARRMEVFGPPVGVSAEDMTVLNQLSAGQRDARFVCIGRLQAWKGFHIAIHAFAKVAREHARVRLQIVGTGPAESALRRLTSTLGIADRIDFSGWLRRREMFRRLATALALVHPSLHDPGAWVVAEALAAGTPVITHEAGGPAVLVGPRWPLLVPYVDTRASVDGVAAHMRRLLGDPQWASQLSEQASQRARSSLTWERQGERMNEVYVSAASRPAL